jgi:hypothetical protein
MPIGHDGTFELKRDHAGTDSDGRIAPAGRCDAGDQVTVDFSSTK